MSLHKKPLTQIEEDGLRTHGLEIGVPSQLSDAFRQGVAWAQQSGVALVDSHYSLDCPVADVDLDTRMKSAGMFSVTELLAGTPMDSFIRNPGVNNLLSFCTWLEARAKEFSQMHALFTLDKCESDEMYEWAVAHMAVFNEVRLNFKAVAAATDVIVPHELLQRLIKAEDDTQENIITPSTWDDITRLDTAWNELRSIFAKSQQAKP